MDSKYNPNAHEERVSVRWEKKGYFRKNLSSKQKTFSIILPPPNANANLHLGHAMYVYEDIMIRYHKLLGDNTLWQYGTDHAGIETQFVFEKHLQKQGKSRFDYSRDELFQMIWDFVKTNKDNMKTQLKRLGFGLDFSNPKFPMDPEIVKIVYETFQHLFNDKLVYRAERLVHYCTSCGTSFSDIEVVYEERKDPLYYMKYGPFVLATVRPETKFGDTGIAVHPKDKRYAQWVGQELSIDGLIGKFKVRVVADDAVDPAFGTGVVKITPSHDFNDYEIAKRHNLPFKQVIGYDGRLNELAGTYKGMKVKAAREQIVKDLKERDLLVKIDADYTHRVGTCYRCKRVLEPLPKEQWFISVKPLAKKAIQLVKDETITLYPKRFKKELIRILDQFIDWNISRQIVWGIRIPAYRCKSKVQSRKSKDKTEFQNDGWFVSVEHPKKCQICGECTFEQDPDTFDTWFSSGQWPFVTLMTSGKEVYNQFYPTSVMETGHDILRPWVARMIMLGVYITGKPPFSTVFLHGLVRDKKGQKMSKSKGNVINPLDVINTYGADVLRASLIFETKEGNDIVLTEEKMIGMRNFGNKIWNIGRLLFLQKNTKEAIELSPNSAQKKGEERRTLKKMQNEFAKVEKKYHSDMQKYRFSQAFGDLHSFIWHRFADYYIEELKESLWNGKIEVLESLKEVYLRFLILLHPFIPFETDVLWEVFHGEETSILDMNIR